MTMPNSPSREEIEEALNGGCSCHSYECHCDSSHLTTMRIAYEAQLALNAKLTEELEEEKKTSKQNLYNWHGAECHFQIATRSLMDDMTAVACELIEREAEYQRAHDLGYEGGRKGHGYKIRAEKAEASAQSWEASFNRTQGLLAEKEDELTRLRALHEACVEPSVELDKLTQAVVEAAMNLYPSEGHWEKEDRMDYDEVQIDKISLKAFRKAVAALDAARGKQ